MGDNTGVIPAGMSTHGFVALELTRALIAAKGIPSKEELIAAYPEIYKMVREAHGAK